MGVIVVLRREFRTRKVWFHENVSHYDLCDIIERCIVEVDCSITISGHREYCVHMLLNTFHMPSFQLMYINILERICANAIERFHHTKFSIHVRLE